MKAKSLLLTSVVGAVAVGGALTGATVASFTDSVPAPAETLRTGSLGLAIDDRPDALSTLTPGDPQQAAVVLAESATGKNLATRRVVSSVDLSGIPDESLTLSFRETKSANQNPCVGRGFSDWTTDSVGQGQQRHLTLADHGRPVGTTQVCVRASLTTQAQALLGAGRTTGSVEVGFTSQQVQDGSPRGWEASTSSGPITVPVSITPTEPGPVACSVVNLSAPDPSLVFTWPAQVGVDTYTVNRVWKRKPSKLLPGTWANEQGTTTWRIPLSQVLTGEDYTEWRKPGGDLGNELRIVASADGLDSPEHKVVVTPTPSGVTCS